MVCEMDIFHDSFCLSPPSKKCVFFFFNKHVVPTSYKSFLLHFQELLLGMSLFCYI